MKINQPRLDLKGRSTTHCVKMYIVDLVVLAILICNTPNPCVISPDNTDELVLHHHHQEVEEDGLLIHLRCVNISRNPSCVCSSREHEPHDPFSCFLYDLFQT